MSLFETVKRRAMRNGLAPLAMLGLASLAGVCQAQSSPGVDVIVSQRIWAPRWEVPLQDGRLVTQGGLPVVQTDFQKSKSDTEAFSITSIAVQYGPWLLGASVSPRTKFSGLPATGGSIERSEYDLSIGYGVLPGLSIALIRKGGRLHQSTTGAMAQLTGVDASQRLSNWLAGVSGSLPFGQGWGVYGNAAYGPGKSKVSLGPLGSERFDTRYTIGEAGLLYSSDLQLGAVKGVDLRFGYRTQIVKLRDATRLTLAVPSLTTVAVDYKDLKSTTAGFVVSASAVF